MALAATADAHYVRAGQWATLGLMILPTVIRTTEESLRSIPKSLREGSYALGATKWQVVRHHLVPYSVGGIATGTIIAMSRALGESAPLMAIGGRGIISVASNEAPAEVRLMIDSALGGDLRRARELPAVRAEPVDTIAL